MLVCWEALSGPWRQNQSRAPPARPPHQMSARVGMEVCASPVSSAVAQVAGIPRSSPDPVGRMLLPAPFHVTQRRHNEDKPE